MQETPQRLRSDPVLLFKNSEKPRSGGLMTLLVVDWAELVECGKERVEENNIRERAEKKNPEQAGVHRADSAENAHPRGRASRCNGPSVGGAVWRDEEFLTVAKAKGRTAGLPLYLMLL